MTMLTTLSRRQCVRNLQQWRPHETRESPSLIRVINLEAVELIPLNSLAMMISKDANSTRLFGRKQKRANIRVCAKSTMKFAHKRRVKFAFLVLATKRSEGLHVNFYLSASQRTREFECRTRRVELAIASSCMRTRCVSVSFVMRRVDLARLSPAAAAAAVFAGANSSHSRP